MGTRMNWKKRWLLNTYARRLPKLLRRDYRPSEFYTPQQIRSTADRYHISTLYLCYALSTFSDRTQFDAYHHAIGESCDYHAMRMDMIETVSANLTNAIMTFFDGLAGGHGVGHDAGHHGSDHGAASAHHGGHDGGAGGHGH